MCVGIMDAKHILTGNKQSNWGVQQIIKCYQENDGMVAVCMVGITVGVLCPIL